MFLRLGEEIQKVLLNKPIMTKEHWRNDARMADKSIFVCPQCGKCWEIITYSTGKKEGKRRHIPQYYNNFVKYGKNKKICPRCK